LETERKKMELEVVRRDAQRMVAELDARLKKLDEETKRFETEKRSYQESLASEGLRKLREVLEEMDAGKAAEMLYDYDINTTAKVLGVIRKDERAAILEAILALDKKRGLTEANGRAGQILKLLANPTAFASAG
jgi:flagellar motility protein MotE (MotC chaperone)